MQLPQLHSPNCICNNCSLCSCSNCTGNSRFSGFAIDLLTAISEVMFSRTMQCSGKQFFSLLILFIYFFWRRNSLNPKGKVFLGLKDYYSTAGFDFLITVAGHSKTHSTILHLTCDISIKISKLQVICCMFHIICIISCATWYNQHIECHMLHLQCELYL